MTQPSEPSAIFICDASAEAERLSDALRARGYAVADVPLSLLVARVAVQRPALILVDVDSTGASAVVGRLRQMPDAAGIPLLFLSEPEAKPDELDELRRPGDAFFVRPIDVRTVVTTIEQLVGPPSALRVPPSTAGLPSGASASNHSMAAISDEHRRPTRFPGAADASGAAQLSPELSSLLREAEERVGDDLPLASSPLPSPEEEIDAVLPPEILAALDEPLGDGDDDDFSFVGEDEKTGRQTASTDSTSVGPQPLREPKTESHAPLRGVEASDVSMPREVQRPTPRLETHPPPARTSEPSLRSPALPPTLAPRRALVPKAPVVSFSPAPNVPPRISVAPSPASSEASVPKALERGEVLGVLATAIASRTTGSLCFETEDGIRRILLRDGDIVTAASGVEDESLLAFLMTRGDLPRDLGNKLRGKLPAFGRRAGAAIIAHGCLEQDQLWPVLRAHAEWIIACALVAVRSTYSFEGEPPARLQAEPSVFGGATGAEVLIEIARRVIPADAAVEKLGGLHARIEKGSRGDLLAECALAEDEASALARAHGGTVEELLAKAPSPELPTVAYVLSLLGVLEILPAKEGAAMPVQPVVDALDAEALRARVRARLDLVEEGDYFALLGVPRHATAYEIRRAYLELRRGFEPSRVLTAETADLGGDLKLIVEVLDEAYDILRDPTRRERYRRAIEAGPP